MAAWLGDQLAEAKRHTTHQLAAGVVLLRLLGQKAPAQTLTALEERYADGGWLAAAESPCPDLLSTAAALQALGPCRERRAAILDFLDSLWSSRGGFHGHWGDDQLDSEYTFHGLVALGTVW